jgi:hypothetical protein
MTPSDPTLLAELWSHVMVNVADSSQVRVIAANEDWPAEASRQVLKDDQS